LGALPTTTFASGTGKQILTNRDVTLAVPVTTTTATGTLLVQLSPDNVTYSTLTPAVNAVTDLVTFLVPAGWYVKLTATNATMATATY
jgi:hypothetical protein